MRIQLWPLLAQMVRAHAGLAFPPPGKPQPASAVSSMYEQSSHLRFAFDTYESCTTGGGRYVPCARRVHAVCDHYRTVRNHAPVESGNLPLPVAFLAWRSTASFSSSCCVRSASVCARVLCVASRTASHERGMPSDSFSSATRRVEVVDTPSFFDAPCWRRGKSACRKYTTHHNKLTRR